MSIGPYELRFKLPFRVEIIPLRTFLIGPKVDYWLVHYQGRRTSGAK